MKVIFVVVIFLAAFQVVSGDDIKKSGENVLKELIDELQESGLKEDQIFLEFIIEYRDKANGCGVGPCFSSLINKINEDIDCIKSYKKGKKGKKGKEERRKYVINSYKKLCLYIFDKQKMYLANRCSASRCVDELWERQERFKGYSPQKIILELGKPDKVDKMHGLEIFTYTIGGYWEYEKEFCNPFYGEDELHEVGLFRYEIVYEIIFKKNKMIKYGNVRKILQKISSL